MRAVAGRPSLDLARDSIGVRDGDVLVAFGVQIGHRITFVHVLPAYRGRGIGTWLMRWSQAAARAIGAGDTSQEISDNERAAIALLERDGYTRRWDSWAFEIGLARRAARAGRRRRLRDPRLRAGPGRAGRVRRDPDRVRRVAGASAGAVRGLGGVHARTRRLRARAARPRRQGRGGRRRGADDRGRERWLDRTARGRARASRARARNGAADARVRARPAARVRTSCGLGTDSRTGARGLYERVGMRVRKTFGEYVKRL